MPLELRIDSVCEKQGGFKENRNKADTVRKPNLEYEKKARRI